LFYLRQRRIWVFIQPLQDDLDSTEKQDHQNLKTELTIAAKDNRNLPETTKEFNELVKQFKEFNDKRPLHESVQKS
jgi:cytochrome c biogenesis protein